MVKDIMTANEAVTPNEKEIRILKEHFPACFSSDGSFDIERFKEYLSDKVAVKNEGYELRFLGKNYARLLASLDTTTVIVPDEEHNSKPENAQSENIYISGDNLDGLKHLLKSYSRKVKCIYIDPPYNTGSDGFVYNDSFNFTAEELSEKLSISDEQANRILDLTKRGSASHSAWLMFMYPRLILARDLLDMDGAIFISIGTDESSNLRLLCDDVFGEENKVGIISRVMKSGGNKGKFFSPNIEYVLVYARNIESLHCFREPLSEDNIGDYSNIETEGVRKGEKYAIKGLCQPGLGIRANQRYWIQAPDGTYLIPAGTNFPQKISEGEKITPSDDDTCWKWTYNRYLEEKAKGNIVFKKSNTATALVDENNNTATWNVYNKIWLQDRLNEGRVPVDIINDNRFSDNSISIEDFPTFCPSEKVIYDYCFRLFENAPKSLISRWENRTSSEEMKLLDIPFGFAKPTDLVSYLINLMDIPDDAIILDFFSGSGTTAHSIMKNNTKSNNSKKKYILIQLPEKVKDNSEEAKYGFSTIDEIGLERIIRAASKLKEENPDTTADLGFRHFTLAEPSLDTLDKLEEFTPETLVLQNNILDDFGVPTVLATWLVRDGYGFTAALETIDFAGYTAYYIDKHLYLINPNLSNDAIAAIVEKIETEGSFNPENAVMFGYSFLWTETESLKVNLARLKDTEKNHHINIDIRY